MAIQAQFPSWGSQDWMDSGCGGFNHFYLDAQQQQKHQLQQQQRNTQQLQNLQSRNQNLCLDNGFLQSPPLKRNYHSIHQSMPRPPTLASYDEKQRQEIDHYIKLQNHRFRLLLQEQRRQQIALLSKRIESKVVPLLRQKDEEIARAAKRTMELEDFLKRLEMESQAWQRVAQENEAMVLSLNNTIEQLRENATSCSNKGAGDAESCCDVNRQVGTVDRNWGFDDDNVGEEEQIMMMPCKRCHSRSSCFLFLPCRHLCSCKACEAFLDSCPVCQTAKKASIEAIMV